MGDYYGPAFSSEGDKRKGRGLGDEQRGYRTEARWRRGQTNGVCATLRHCYPKGTIEP
jgi:hypothetical protein